MTSRRRFLKQGTLGALAAGFTFGLGDKVNGRTADAVPGTFGLNQAAFSAQLHTTFLVNDGVRRVPLELRQVVDFGSRKANASRREAFALVLRGNNSLPLQQGTYSIEHEKLGGFSLLVVPVLSRDKNARYYEININRLHG
jgi:uncharacterized protein DUF6916